MRKMTQKIVAIILSIVLICSLTGCSSKSQIKDTLNEFEYACQNLDISAMLRCIDPVISDPIRLGMALLSGTTGIDYEDLVDVLFANIKSLGIGGNFDPKVFLNTLSLSKEKIKVKKNKATVNCLLGFEIAGEHFDKPVTIDMIKDDDNWYIAGFSLQSDK